MTRTISVRLPDSIYEELEKRADELAIAPAVLARVLLKISLDNGGLGEALKKEQKDQQRRKEMGGPVLPRRRSRRRGLGGEGKSPRSLSD